MSRLMWAEGDPRDDLPREASAAVAVTGKVHLAGLLRDHLIARSLWEATLGLLIDRVRHDAEALGGLALGAPRGSPVHEAPRVLRGGAGPRRRRHR